MKKRTEANSDQPHDIQSVEKDYTEQFSDEKFRKCPPIIWMIVIGTCKIAFNFDTFFYRIMPRFFHFLLWFLGYMLYVIHVFFYYHTNIGDVIHSFTDGIAVGGAYAKSFYGGLGTTIAIVCHEVPHCVGKTS